MKIFILLLLTLILISCAKSGIVKTSKELRPDWLYGFSRDYIITTGQASSISGARRQALRDVKLELLKSISIKVKSSMYIHLTSKSTSDDSSYSKKILRKYSEETGFINSLKGLSLNRVHDYYWEHKKTNGKNVFLYHVKYNMPKEDVNKYIDIYNATKAKFDERIELIEVQVNLSRSEKALIEMRSELKFLLNFVDGSSKIKAGILLAKIDHIKENIEVKFYKANHTELCFRTESYGKRFDIIKAPIVHTHFIKHFVVERDGKKGHCLRYVNKTNNFNFERKNRITVKVDIHPNLSIKKNHFIKVDKKVHKADFDFSSDWEFKTRKGLFSSEILKATTNIVASVSNHIGVKLKSYTVYLFKPKGSKVKCSTRNASVGKKYMFSKPIHIKSHGTTTFTINHKKEIISRMNDHKHCYHLLLGGIDNNGNEI